MPLSHHRSHSPRAVAVAAAAAAAHYYLLAVVVVVGFVVQVH